MNEIVTTNKYCGVSWIKSHLKDYEFFFGVPQLVRDNLFSLIWNVFFACSDYSVADNYYSPTFTHKYFSSIFQGVFEQKQSVKGDQILEISIKSNRNLENLMILDL